MRRLLALALVLCAGCASSNSDVADAMWGDLRSFFHRDDDSNVNVTSSTLGYTSTTPPITSKPQAASSE